MSPHLSPSFSLILVASISLVASTLGAQINPTEDFSTQWVASPAKALTTFSVQVNSRRNTVTVLDYRLEVVSQSANDEQRAADQGGLVVVPPLGSDTAGRVAIALQPGDFVEARIKLTHLQEGWQLTDTLRRTFGQAPQAATRNPQLAVDPNFLEIDGLIIDRTLTKSGQDFYELFFRDWQAPFGARSFSVLIEESPWRGRQTVVKVSVDEQLIFQRILQPRYDALEELAGAAVAVASDVLQRRIQAERSNDGAASEQLEVY